MSHLALTPVAPFTAHSLRRHYAVLPVTKFCPINLTTYRDNSPGNLFLYVALPESFVSRYFHRSLNAMSCLSSQPHFVGYLLDFSTELLRTPIDRACRRPFLIAYDLEQA